MSLLPLCPITLPYLWVMNRGCFIMKWGWFFWALTPLYLVACSRPWRAHLNLALLFPGAPPQRSWVLLVAMEDVGKWWCGAGRQNARQGRGVSNVHNVSWGRPCQAWFPAEVLIVLCRRFVFSLLWYGVGECLETSAAQWHRPLCFCTWLPSSNASRPSRLWPPSGSRGARPLKSQLWLILCACQIFHSPAVHLRNTGHCSLYPFCGKGKNLLSTVLMELQLKLECSQLWWCI